ncbi:MAG: right-handed parallel beta-helix repeat-containing protein [Myxococcales bacterium]
MRRALLILWVSSSVAACQFSPAGPSDLWPCADGGGDNCDRNGNPIAGGSTGTGSGSSTGTGSTASGSTGLASGSSGSGSSGSSPSSSGSSTGSTRTGSTSGSSSGGGTTGCPAPGGAVYVSQGLGSDATGSGIAAPASCAFRTLTHALAAAAGAGLPAVIAEGATAAAPATFSAATGESFPLTVPAGVALTTDLEVAGGVSRPAYAIAFDNPTAAGPMVALAPDASIAGFTVYSDGGNPNADGVDCAAGQGAVIDCALQGASAGTGVGFNGSGSCDATLTKGSIEGFGGAGVSLDGTGTSAITGETIAGNGVGNSLCMGDGLLMRGGTLSLQSVTFESNLNFGLDAVAGTVTGSNVTFLGSAAGVTGPKQGYGLGLGIIPVSAVGGPCPPDAGLPSSAQVTLTGAVVQGILNYGVGVNGGSLTLLDPLITDCSVGIQLNTPNFPGSSVVLANPVVNHNSRAGLREFGQGTLLVDGGTVGPDDQWLGGDSEIYLAGDETVTLAGTRVQGNPDYNGIRLAAGTCSLIGCDITGNDGGGLALSAGKLAAFTGNRIHGNGGYQISAAAGVWNLDGAACDGGQNEIDCYATGYVGLAVADGGSVQASFEAWENGLPSAGVDYSGNVQIGLGGVCPPITSCDGG